MSKCIALHVTYSVRVLLSIERRSITYARRRLAAELCCLDEKSLSRDYRALRFSKYDLKVLKTLSTTKIKDPVELYWRGPAD